MGDTMFVLVYVNDILITGNNTYSVGQVIA